MYMRTLMGLSDAGAPNSDYLYTGEPPASAPALPIMASNVFGNSMIMMLAAAFLIMLLSAKGK